jgi:hypothetical protein
VTSYNTVVLADNYLTVGSVITVASDGSGGNVGGGGGSGGGSGGPRLPQCTVEGTELDTPDGPLDNRVIKARFDAGEAVYLMGRNAPERLIGAEWHWVDTVQRITVGEHSFECSDSHTVIADGRHQWCSNVPSGSLIETRTGLRTMTREAASKRVRVLRVHLEGPSHEYSAYGVLSHNTKVGL